MFNDNENIYLTVLLVFIEKKFVLGLLKAIVVRRLNVQLIIRINLGSVYITTSVDLWKLLKHFNIIACN